MFNKLITRISSRKFIVWVTATVFYAFERMTTVEWIICSGLFIGGKATEKALDTYKEIKTIGNVQLAQQVKEV